MREWLLGGVDLDGGVAGLKEWNRSKAGEFLPIFPYRGIVAPDGGVFCNDAEFLDNL